MNGTPDAFDARDRVPGNIATTYLGERDGSERIGVRVGRDRYVILTRPAKGMNAETVGYKVVLRSGRTYPTPDAAIDAALAAIAALPDGKATVF